MRAIIIDDELKSREVLGTIITQFIKHVHIVGGAADISGGIQLILSAKPDLVFLDISLKDGDSFAILKQLTDIDFKIIFITAFDEYATQAINFTHIPCLNKPIDIDELENAISKAKQTEMGTVKEDVSIILSVLNSKFKTIPVVGIFNVTFISDKNLIYLVKKGNETSLFTNKGEEIVSWYPFERYIHLLKNHSFAQPNGDVLVLLDAVSEYPQINHKTLSLSNHTNIPLTEDYKADFIKRFDAFQA